MVLVVYVLSIQKQLYTPLRVTRISQISIDPLMRVVGQVSGCLRVSEVYTTYGVPKLDFQGHLGAL